MTHEEACYTQCELSLLLHMQADIVRVPRRPVAIDYFLSALRSAYGDLSTPRPRPRPDDYFLIAIEPNSLAQNPTYTRVTYSLVSNKYTFTKIDKLVWPQKGVVTK